MNDVASSIVNVFGRREGPSGKPALPSVVVFQSTPRRTRTCNLRFRRPMLYPLS